ncbi:unnamed protein product [Cylicocyclus nassatus]|uniref:Uncharacterized protein n=1 Tax=Cylicocyclus nassatus TaxID=53992 RepID=A0AA36H2Q6_CYLNA|nr:unnamed protein product [Cylicocyclus nassatus]
MENISISLDHAKKMLDNIETMRSSSDSVVRALTAVVREQSHFIARLPTVTDYILTKQREQDRQLQKTKYHVPKIPRSGCPKVTYSKGRILRNLGFGEKKCPLRWCELIRRGFAATRFRINAESTNWWTNLGKDDKERTKAFDVLSQARMDRAVFARIALERAL